MTANVSPALPVVPPIPPLPPAPPLPTDLQKMIPFYVKIAGLAFIGLGAWIQDTLAPSPQFQELFPNSSNVIGLAVMVLGALGGLCSKFPEAWNNKKFQDVIAHKDAVIDHKDEVISVTSEVADQSKAIAIDASKAPALVPDGENPVAFRLRLALTEATQCNDFESATEILGWLKNRKAVPA